MKPELQIKALAELDGWQKRRRQIYDDLGPIGKLKRWFWCRGKQQVKEYSLPDYLTSYDAIIPLIQKQRRCIRENMWNYLDAHVDIWDVSVQLLCKALLHATGKWIE